LQDSPVLTTQARALTDLDITSYLGLTKTDSE